MGIGGWLLLCHAGLPSGNTGISMSGLVKALRRR